MTIRKLMSTGAIAVLLGVGALAAASTGAQARTVCNRWGDCWHADHDYSYPAQLGIRIYGDDWRARHHWNDSWRWQDRDYRWHEHHDGRGYWRDGVWVTF